MTAVFVVVGLLVVATATHGLLRNLRPVPRATRRGGPASVSVIIPARNEEASLPALLSSLDQLTTPVQEIVVVDDGSQDATASVARAAGATVLEVTDPPPGWTGKAWACQRGADATSGELLLFLDADTTLAADALDGLLALHEQHGGLVSVQPFHEVVRAYEQLSSYFNVVSLLASGAFGTSPGRRAAAFGPCLLTTRADYERVGGHATVRGEILDDVRLAHAYQRAALPVTCAIGGRSLRMRMYPGGIGQLAEGWTKNFASGASAAAPVPTLLAVLWVAVHHAVAVGAVLALVRVATDWGPPPVPDLILWATAWVGVAWQLRWLLRRIGSFRWWTWAFFPGPLLAFDVLFARSAALTLFRRSVRWRGRDVRLTRRTVPTEEA